MPEDWNSLKLIRETTGYFEKAGIPDRRLDAELLLAHALGCKRIDLYTRHEKILKEKDRTRFKELIRRRVRREPLQYILGETEFYGLKFKVTPEVLIPRPETELLVEETIKIVGAPLGAPQTSGAASSAPTNHEILEIGTGSGCIAVTLAKHLPEASIVATDISKQALEVARENARRHDVEGRIELILADIAPWKRFAAEGRTFDSILSNPPYIPTGEFSKLQPEVRDFEPRRALDGGADGLDFYRSILQDAVKFLKPGASLLFEIGEDQGEKIRQMIAEAGLREIQIKKDLNRKDRLALGRGS